MANINPMQIMSMMNTRNPQQAMMGFLKNNSSNPVAKNLMNMIDNKDAAGIEQLARNLAKEKGIDIDSMYNQMFGRR